MNSVIQLIQFTTNRKIVYMHLLYGNKISSLIYSNLMATTSTHTCLIKKQVIHEYFVQENDFRTHKNSLGERST